jgi:hypothetical protein
LGKNEVIYTTYLRDKAENFALQLNGEQQNNIDVFYEVDEIAPGIWRVVRIFRRSSGSAWERESVPLPEE